MNKHEYEQLTETTVCDYDYYNIIEPMYMATNLSKQDFVRTINTKAFDMPKPIEPDKLVRVRIPYKKNEFTGKWDTYYTMDIIAKFVDWDIGSGCAEIKLYPEKKHNELMEKVYDIEVDYVLDLDRCCGKNGRKLGKAFYNRVAKITDPKFMRY